MAKEIGQVFGGIGDAVSGVLKGVGDAVDGAVKGVGTLAKQIYDSDIGKAIIIAGAIYFGGAALSGGFGSMGAGGSFLSGMGTGVSSAASSLSSAWGLATSGEAGSLSQAASTIGSSWGAAGDAGANAARFAAGSGLSAAAPSAASVASAPAAAAAPAAAPAAATPAVASGAPGVLSPAAASAYTPVVETAAGAPAATQPWYSQALDYLTPKSDLAKYGLISGATSVAGHVISGIGQQQAAQEQREYEAEQLRKAQELRNANVGSNLFAPGQYATAPGPAPMPVGLARRYMPQVAPGSPGYVPGSQFAQMYGQLPPGYGAVQSVMGA